MPEVADGIYLRKRVVRCAVFKVSATWVCVHLSIVEQCCFRVMCTAGDSSLKKSPSWSSVSSNCCINVPVTKEGSVFLCDLLCWLVKNGQLLFHLVQPFHSILINRCN